MKTTMKPRQILGKVKRNELSILEGEMLIQDFYDGIRHSDKEAIREEMIEFIKNIDSKIRKEDLEFRFGKSWNFGRIAGIKSVKKDLLAYLKQLK